MSTPDHGPDPPTPNGLDREGRSTPGPGPAPAPAPAFLPVPLLAFGLIPGPRELLLVVVVALVLYGRSGSRVVIASRKGRPPGFGVRMVRRALGLPADPRPRRGAEPAAEPSPRSGRLFWALTLIAAAAVAALVVSHAVIHTAVSPPR